MSIEPDTDAAIDFLHFWSPDGPWTLAAKVRPDSMTTRAFTELRASRDFIDEHNGRHNIYFVVNPTKALVNKKPSAADISELAWLHLDVDPRPGEDLDTERRRILTLLRGHDPEPTCIIFSGGGYQAFWRLDEPIHITDPADAKLWNMALEKQLGGDNCHNIDRIMRLPGTVNIPDEKKRKKGRVEVLAKLVDPNDNTHNLDQFEKAPARVTVGPPQAGEEPAGDLVAHTTIDLSELDQYFEPKDAGKRDDVKIIIGAGYHPLKPKEGDNSRSAWVFDACCNLARHSNVPDGVILGILLDPVWGISESVLEKKGGGQEYALRQIAKAHEFVARDTLGPPVLHKGEPLRSAREFKSRTRPTLMHFNDDWLSYDGAAYADIENASIKSELYAFLDKAVTPGKKDEPMLPFCPDKQKVANVVDALQGDAHVPQDRYTPPCWLEGSIGPPPYELLACRNGLLHLPTLELHQLTSSFFTRNGLDFDYDAEAGPPERWRRFLRELWGDGDEIDVLQEIMGYLLVPDTSQQKIFLLVGPTRSGKGTIGRVIRGLVGDHNTAGPSLNTLGTDFGLSNLIGKQLATVSDMRIGQKTDRALVVENLLKISGEDVVDAARKYKQTWTGQMSVRFLILTNELPRLPDDSGALASRFVPLMMTESFLDKEDRSLTRDLLRELPGILRWAITGWQRLQERGHFLLPKSSRDTVANIHTLGSPVAAFLEECLVLEPTGRVEKTDVWRRWTNWCEGHGIKPGDISRFGQQLIAAGQGRVRQTKPRIDGRQVPHYAGVRPRAEDDDSRPDRVMEPYRHEQEEIPF